MWIWIDPGFAALTMVISHLSLVIGVCTEAWMHGVIGMLGRSPSDK